MIIFATPEDYVSYAPEAPYPANITSLLRSASLLVAEETVASYYTVGDDGQATDTNARDALRDATCAQAAVWAQLGVDPNLVGLDRAAPVKTARLLSGSYERDTSFQSSTVAFDATQQVICSLCEDGQRILRQAGMLTTQVWTYG